MKEELIMEQFTFGELLKERRKRRGLTQRQLATRLGVHYNTISFWERGSYLPDSKTIVLELARLLKLNESETRQLLEASLTALSFYWNVPYQRNTFFTGREDILQKMHAILAQEQGIAAHPSYALSGMAGIGKTQLAVEYAYRHFHDYTAVLWVGAETEESIATSFMTIADLLKLTTRYEQDYNKVISAIERWLNTHRNWLLVYDNVEDLRLLLRQIPSGPQGSQLFTTRLTTLGPLTTSRVLEPLAPGEGTQFLLRRTGYHGQIPLEEYAAATTLTELMGGLPLALEQAASYIDKSRGSLTDFLASYQIAPMQILNKQIHLAYYPDSVAKTFAFSFEKIQQADPAAADLLILCSLLAPEDIPEALIAQGATNLSPQLETALSSPFLRDNLFDELLSYSFIQRNPQTHSLTIHRLVQEVLKGMHSEETLRLWLGRAIGMLNQTFPIDQKLLSAEQWPWCERLLPHALSVINKSKHSQPILPDLGSLLLKIATYLCQRARYTEAETLFQQALSLQESLENPSPLDLATILSGLANTYLQQRKDDQAKATCLRILSIFDAPSQENYQQMAQALQGLAFLHYEMDAYKDSEEHYRNALDLYEQFGPDNYPRIGAILVDLANLYERQGQYTEAVQLVERAVDTLKMGEDRSELGNALNSLAILHRGQGKYKEAEFAYQQALSINEQTLGPNHTEVGTLLNNLAHLYVTQGRYREAEPLYLRAIHIREQIFGPTHFYTAFTLNNLGFLYCKQKRYAEAEPLLQKVLHVYEQRQQEDQPILASPLENLALLYYKQGQYARAEGFASKAFTIRQQVLPPNHPDIARPLTHLANIYVKQGKYEKAETFYHRALDICIAALGSDHPETAHLFKKQAALYVEQGRYTEAEPLFYRALHLLEQRLEGDHPAIASTLYHLADLYIKQNKQRDGERLHYRARTIWQKQGIAEGSL